MRMRDIAVTLICGQITRGGTQFLAPDHGLPLIAVMAKPYAIIDIWHMLRDHGPIAAKPVARQNNTTR